MSSDAKDLIAYLEKARHEERDDLAGVVITENAAFNLISELELLMEKLQEADEFIAELIAERDDLQSKLEAIE